MIVMDRPQAWGHRLGPSCHLLSDLTGPDGSEELEAFARRLGLKPGWLQKKGTAHEHYDLFGSRIKLAEKLGAVVISRLAMVTIFRAKRGMKPIQACPHCDSGRHGLMACSACEGSGQAGAKDGYFPPR